MGLPDVGEPVRQLLHERDLLGRALGELLVAIGLVRADAPLTGPQLLCAADDAVRWVKERSFDAALSQVPQNVRWVVGYRDFLNLSDYDIFYAVAYPKGQTSKKVHAAASSPADALRAAVAQIRR